MAATHTIETTELTEIVEPFAQLMGGPPVLPQESQMAALQEYYGASEHADFHQPDGYVPWARTNAYKLPGIILPFSLALGLHPSGPEDVNRDALAETFATYAAQTTLFIYEGGPNAERRVQRDRTTRVLSTAIMSAAVQPVHAYSQQKERIKKAVHSSQELGLLSRSQSRLLRHTVEFIRL
jgi:hypothetical protein